MIPYREQAWRIFQSMKERIAHQPVSHTPPHGDDKMDFFSGGDAEIFVSDLL